MNHTVPSARAPAHTDAEYRAINPFLGDESVLTCRNVVIRTARKRHVCFGLAGAQDHLIEPGQRYRFETARVDGDFWGSWRICLACMDRHVAEYEGEDEGD